MDVAGQCSHRGLLLHGPSLHAIHVLRARCLCGATRGGMDSAGFAVGPAPAHHAAGNCRSDLFAVADECACRGNGQLHSCPLRADSGGLELSGAQGIRAVLREGATIAAGLPSVSDVQPFILFPRPWNSAGSESACHS